MSIITVTNDKTSMKLENILPLQKVTYKYTFYSSEKQLKGASEDDMIGCDDYISYDEIPYGSLCVFDADRFGYRNICVMIDHNPVCSLVIFPHITVDKNNNIQLGKDQLSDSMDEYTIASVDMEKLAMQYITFTVIAETDADDPDLMPTIIC